MIKRKFFGKKLAGRFVLNDRKSYEAFLASFDDGQEMEMTLSKKVKKRSLAQNAYYWGCVLPIISAETGHSCEELHEIYKRMFLPKQIIEYRDKHIAVPGSTPEASTTMFSEYIDRIGAEAAEMGITIPNPDQAGF